MSGFSRNVVENAETFSFSDCSFKVQRCKETTGRVVVWRECDIPNSYALEARCWRKFWREKRVAYEHGRL